MLGSIPDLLRLVAVPVFGWAAYRDVKTRRIPNQIWGPLALFAALLLIWDAYTVVTGPGGRLFFLQVSISLGFVVPLSYAFWRIGGFGGADAKAFMLIAVLFPVYPTYLLTTPSVALPLEPTTLGVFSLTILSNTVLAGVVYPLGVAASNVARGEFDLAMFIGKPVAVDDLPEQYGRLLESPEGFTRRGLDLDALRMYLQYRGLTLAEVLADPERYRDPGSLPVAPNPPGDGSIATDGGEPVTAEETADTTAPADPWGAEQFLEDIDHSAYGATPAQLREGLDVLVEQEEVWVSPGIPFIVPMFAGLVVSLTYGDVLFVIMQAVGLA